MGYNENSTINYPVLFVDFFMIYAYNKDKINQWRCILWRLRQIFYKVLFLSQFNKGQAAKIFDRLHSEKELIVLKNNQPSAIILSPEEYARLTEIEEDYFLLLEANKRIEDNGNNETISFDSVMKNLGISEDELLDTEGVDLE